MLADAAIEVARTLRERSSSLARSSWSIASRAGREQAFSRIFFIGAHAAVSKLALLTRDVGRHRTYFPSMALIAPEKSARAIAPCVGPSRGVVTGPGCRPARGWAS
jgi:predicted nucleic acid-binding protein